MWPARNSPAFAPCFSRQPLRFSATSRMPTVIWVGRSSFIGVAVKMGSRIIGRLARLCRSARYVTGPDAGLETGALVEAMNAQVCADALEQDVVTIFRPC